MSKIVCSSKLVINALWFIYVIIVNSERVSKVLKNNYLVLQTEYSIIIRINLIPIGEFHPYH